jgi:mannose-6-phosphate isomerase-like protein (cupin superfamily)
MNVLRKESAPRYRRPEGITSFLLASPRTCTSKHLTTTLVELEVGGSQRIHSHAPEQVYFILAGSGEMTVGTETRQVGPGDCVFIPSGSPHGIVNRGSEPLRYFSAAAPAFTPEELATVWPLPSEGA